MQLVVCAIFYLRGRAMLGNLRENRVLSSGAYHVTGGCNKRGMVDFGLSFARAACLRILPQWLSSFTVTLSIFTLAFVFSLNTINTARADVCFLPNAEGCEQVPYNEYLCTGDDCPEPEITCEASNNCYETEVAAMSARDVKDSYYKNGDCWCLKDSCPSSIYNIADKGEGWNCSGQCTDGKSKNYGKYSLCSPKACSKGTTDCSASDCKICQNTDPVEYSGDYVCQESVDIGAYCPEDFPLTEAPNGCYNEKDKKCGEGKCYQSYNLKCDGEHQIVTGSGTACSCGCDNGYEMNDAGQCVSSTWICGDDCVAYMRKVTSNKYGNNIQIDIVGEGEMYDYSDLHESSSIGDRSYYNDVPWVNYLAKISSVNIDDGITYVGKGAFRGAFGLTDVTGMNSVTSIGDDAFRETCIENIDLSKVSSIGNGAFYNANYLTSAILSKAITIGEGAFYSSGLENISIPEVQTIGDIAFLDTSLTSVYMPKVTTIGKQAFSSASALTSVTMPKVTTIGEMAFYNDTKLTSVTMPKVEKIERAAFNQAGLTSVDMPNVKEIGEMAFYRTKLSCIYLPNIEKLGSYAFGKSSLRTALLSDKVQYCSSGSCSPITNYTANYGGTFRYIFSDTTIAEKYDSWTKSGQFLLSAYAQANACWNHMSCGTNCTAYFTYDTSEDGNKLLNITGTGEVTSTPWSSQINYITSVNVSDGITSIKEKSFQNARGLTKVNMPSVTSIGDRAFDETTSLKEVNMPSVTSIGKYAFSSVTVNYESSLTDVYMPNVTSISERAFLNAKKIETLNLPEVTTIGDYAFSGAKKLTRIDLPKATTFGAYAFKDATALTCIRVSSQANYCESGTCSAISNKNFQKLFKSAPLWFSDCTTSGGYLTCEKPTSTCSW